MIIECDSELVVRTIRSNLDYLLEVGHVIVVCRMKMVSRSDLSVSHIKKQTNRAAHLLARVPCLIDCFNVFESPPKLFLETLLSENCSY